VTTNTAFQCKSIQHRSMPRDRRYYSVYILGSISGMLYIGFRGNLHKRIFQYKFHHYEGFTDKYSVIRLFYWESYDDVHKDCADRATESALGRFGCGMVPLHG